MATATRIKPISYLKTHAAELLRDVRATGQSVTITQNGEAKVVVMDVRTHDRWRAALALMKLVKLGERDVEQGRLRAQQEVFDRAAAKLDG